MRILTQTVMVMLGVCLFSCVNGDVESLDMSGEWHFKMDSLDVGVSEKWYVQVFEDVVMLPGSMAENGKGDKVSVNTKWTGQIVDSAWFKSSKYAAYRKPGNVKIPFWLQPEIHYVGAAWYQKQIVVPSEWQDKVVELRLERPHWETQVWVDGNYVGKQNSLGTPHVYRLTDLKPGKYIVSIRIDNSIHDIDPGLNSHSITDHTQSNWNGIAGTIQLTKRGKLFLDNVRVYPDVVNKMIKVAARINNYTGDSKKCKLKLEVKESADQMKSLGVISKEVTIDTVGQFEIDYLMGDKPLLWDEFTPNLYTMDLSLQSPLGTDTEQVTFGMREFKVDGTRFAINGRPVFLRGTLECAIFPKTGYPATDVETWKRILNVCKAHGLNHMRFHSWCPPEAAFEAADQLGVYLQVEVSSWANVSSSIGNGLPIDKWLYREAECILDAYGNHPSFVMMAYGNEPGGKNQKAYLSEFVSHFKDLDNRRVYTGGAGWPYIENQDYYNNAAPRIQGWGAGLRSVINSRPPETVFDYNDIINKTPMPYVSHEIGQWCAYPNFKEIQKYTGVLKAKNFEIFKETLEENHMGHLADSFLLASGKLQALCYKADIEAALRTRNFAGFQLLDLHDFPGQGTALVGVLDAFWEEKGYITPEEYSRFCNETVPLARLEKRVFNNHEIFTALIEIAHFGSDALNNPKVTWELSNMERVVSEGDFQITNIPIGNGFKLGTVEVDLKGIKSPQKLTLTVRVEGFFNSWDVWVYPLELEEIESTETMRMVKGLDAGTLEYLINGGKVLLSPKQGTIKPEMGGAIGVGFSSIFWNTAWTRGQKPHTLGVLCNPEHPLLAEFPTEYHSNWQWWDAMSHSNAIILDAFSLNLKPIVRVIDDWFTNRRLALIFEAKVGKGKLLFSGIDLHSDLKDRPEARQLLYSVKKYMLSEQFNPKEALTAESVRGLFNN
ncbi:sugar-binding domain-containing protein [Snuella sedimenti]|uniref:beta-galactosidase n=1 Tax=Snuella sedimenti TaxID=2798802 RepID=A0A8J7IUU5_9FLAO|nr:sugar-binding domain-containing protein [Snuella sedimenti]MBJ6367135.1 beta-glucuronidase [Snuella sedimenti]